MNNIGWIPQHNKDGVSINMFEAQRIIDLRPNTKDTEFNINDEDLKNGYIGYASWDSKISIPLRS